MQNLNFIDYLNDEKAFDSFVEARYIQVSGIIKGGEANASGQVMQEYVKKELSRYLINKKNLMIDKDVRKKVSGNSYDSDIAVENTDTGKFVFIEVSFQVTTNSTIERKRGEAPERYNAFSKEGHYSVYVIDGTGSLHDRPSAVRQIISNSHYVTTCSDQGLSKLAQFTEDVLT